MRTRNIISNVMLALWAGVSVAAIYAGYAIGENEALFLNFLGFVSLLIALALWVRVLWTMLFMRAMGIGKAAEAAFKQERAICRVTINRTMLTASWAFQKSLFCPALLPLKEVVQLERGRTPRFLRWGWNSHKCYVKVHFKNGRTHEITCLYMNQDNLVAALQRRCPRLRK